MFICWEDSGEQFSVVERASQWVRVLCDCGWLSRGHCEPSGVTAKDQKVAMPLNRKWDCSDDQGLGPFPGILEPHKIPGSMLILKVIASIMTRTGQLCQTWPFRFRKKKIYMT